VEEHEVLTRDIVLERVLSIKRSLRENALDSDHPPDLLAVTKTQPISTIDLLPFDEIAGVGENRADETLRKYGRDWKKSQIHMIGRLQTNKVQSIIGRVSLVHSLDRESLAKELDRCAAVAGLKLDCLVQVNIGNESQKGGVPPASTKETVRGFARYPNLRIVGLMAILPMVDPNGNEDGLGGLEELRPMFRQMRKLYLELQEEAVNGTSFSVLSMGMSADSIIAAQEGATMVRIGSALFGARHG
jgi:pyridoxal phosphate enzyme (YggS family)